ncbi:MAG: fibrobacter succinogenes major paralogous domain-containing protein [Flavobacteriales bacterium]|nr:fibrobacter succinogenes major paralogous domain-containing protein [Flavobacteriales bacterium]
MRHTTLPFALLLAASPLFAQNIVITFDATVNAVPAPLDSIRVMNLTQGGDTTIVFPGNTLVLGTTGIADARSLATSMQSWPNPFAGSTDLLVSVDEPGEMLIAVHDATGRECAAQRVQVQPGMHRFQLATASAGVHVVSVLLHGKRSTLRVLATGDASASGTQLSYLGAADVRFGNKSGRSAFTWQPGDELRYIGYAFPGNILNSDAIDEVPVASATRTFVMQRGAVCPDSPTVTDIDGNVYRTAHIGNQCWTAQELRTSRFANGDDIPTVQDDAEWSELATAARCSYNNDPATGADFGSLYNWYVVSDPRNVCPAGWHVASDAEWMELETTMGMPAEQLEVIGVRGAIQGVGGKLKAQYLWTPPNPNNMNFHGFAALPTGRRLGDSGVFLDQPQVGYWWTTTLDDEGVPLLRTMHFGSMGVARGPAAETFGYGVRCIQD